MILVHNKSHIAPADQLTIAAFCILRCHLRPQGACAVCSDSLGQMDGQQNGDLLQFEQDPAINEREQALKRMTDWCAEGWRGGKVDTYTVKEVV